MFDDGSNAIHDGRSILHRHRRPGSNTVEGFFATLTKRRLKRGVFRSVADLQAAINRFLEEHNQQSQPFTWTADPDKIIAAVRRGHQMLIRSTSRLLKKSPAWFEPVNTTESNEFENESNYGGNEFFNSLLERTIGKGLLC